MKDSVLFRRVLFGGYHKGDVEEYVEQLEEKNEKLLFSKNDEISALQEEIEKLQMEIELWETRYNELEDSTSRTIRRMETQLDEVQEEASRIIVRQRKEAEEILQNVRSRVSTLLAARENHDVPTQTRREGSPEDTRDHVIKLKKRVG